MKSNKKGKGIWKLSLGIIIILLVLSAISTTGGGSSYNQNSSKHKTARETAELAVQSKKFGFECYTESKVVYENDDYIIVAVKYGLSEDDDSYWLTFVRCYGGGKYWNSMIDGKGVDYDNIPKEIMDDLKIRWELK